MEKLFEGEIYEMIAQPSGLVFAYSRSDSDEGTIIGYKMLSLDTCRLTDVIKDIYQLSKFGSAYRAVAAVCDNYITARSVILPSGRVFICNEYGDMKLIDTEGECVWNGELTYRGHGPSALVLHGNTVWASFEGENVLMRCNPATMREELRIGGARSPLDRPTNIFVENDMAYICNAGSNKIVKINLTSYAVEDYKEFEEPILGFMRVKNFDFYLLKSGLYTDRI